jgi:hypothetical protein
MIQPVHHKCPLRQLPVSSSIRDEKRFNGKVSTKNPISKPEPMPSLIQIPVILEILISCFLRPVEVDFSQWANQPGEPREIRILRCGVVRGIARLARGMPNASPTGLKGERF